MSMLLGLREVIMGGQRLVYRVYDDNDLPLTSRVEIRSNLSVCGG
jgi:hypothetical protein